MAFGLISDSGSAQINGEILGGLVTGTNGEFLALPISSTVLGGLSGLTTNQWSRFYLSDSFGAASGSVIQALNYLSASIKSNADADVEGPSSATDNAVARFDGTSGKLIQDTSVVTITDAGTIAGGAGGNSYGLSSAGQISGASGVIAGTTVSGAGGISGQALTLPGATVDIAGKMVVSGVLAGNNNISSSAAIIAGTNVSGAGGVSGQSLAIGGAANLFAVTNAGLVEGGAGGDSYTITAAGAISGASSIIAGTTISGAGAAAAQSLTVANSFKVTSAGDLSSSKTAHFVNAVTGLSFAASSSLSAKTTISGAGALAAASLQTEEATISIAGVVSGAGAVQGQKLTIADSDVVTTAGAVAAVTTVSGAGAVSGKSLTTEEATISVAGAYSGSGGITGQSLTIANLFKATSDGSITGSGLATFSNTEVAQGGGYKPALIISSSEISTAANAALIPRFIIQGTNNQGGLADFMISVSGGMFQVQELSNGTWPV